MANQKSKKLFSPCDFDYSGIINTEYAVPFETLNLKNVKERRFMGFCRAEEEFKKTFALFERHKEAIFEVYGSNCLLNKKFKKQSLTYLEEFYKIIANKYRMKYDFVRGCRWE